MRKLLVLFGLVLSVGWGGTALAQSGSDSSGTHSYSLECNGEDLVFSNTGEGTLRILVSLAFGQPAYTVNAGESKNFGTPGIDTGPPGTHFEVWFEDPEGSNNFFGMDEGAFPACTAEPPTTATTAPPTTQPTEPTTPTPGLNPITGEGYVSPGAEIGPGLATFGASGFSPGDSVFVALHSMPRWLGFVTANDVGIASITFEVLASDGAGTHSVRFTGTDNRSVSIPFTLVLPEGATATTTTVAGQLPVTR